MKLHEDIILRPHITEKSNNEAALGIYTFVVSDKATKVDIKKAVEKLFNVKVLSVNTQRYKGKKKRLGVHQGYTPKWKKAIVRIATEPVTETYLTKGGKAVTVARKNKTAIEEFGFVE